MTKYESMTKWADREQMQHSDIYTWTNGAAHKVGVMIDTDLYTGPYPDQRTRDAVEAVKKAAVRRGCVFQVHPMMCAVYIMTEQ